ncbi:MAG: tRNA lysidine(34) synthetase TilS [Bacteroidota bacterium]
MLWPTIQQTVANTIATHRLLNRSERVLVAISGGPDSVLLAYTLIQLGYEVGLAHVNYNLRAAASDDEEKLVRRYAKAWQVPVYVQNVDTKAHAIVKQLSFQEAARKLRYDFFEQLMAEEAYSKCATGHQANDQIESVLMSLFKGNSPQILRGIPRARGPYIRPLIDLSRTDVLNCLAELELEYGVDHTNDENNYLRNQFRNQVIPILHHINPSVGDQIIARHDWYQQQNKFLKSILDQCLARSLRKEKGGMLLNWTDFVLEYGTEQLALLVIAAGESWGWHGHALWRLLELIQGQKGKFIEREGERIYRHELGLFFQPSKVPISLKTIKLPSLPKLGTLRFGERKIHLLHPAIGPFQFGEPGCLYLNSEAIQLPIEIRPWRQGDKMQPFGMQGLKKLSDIFVDQKYSPFQKEQAIVFADQKQIIALSDFRIADPLKVDEQTNSVLKIVIEDQF